MHRAFRSGADRERELHQPSRRGFERPGLGAGRAELFVGPPNRRMPLGDATGAGGKIPFSHHRFRLLWCVSRSLLQALSFTLLRAWLKKRQAERAKHSTSPAVC
jgi:hypothetical protein